MTTFSNYNRNYYRVALLATLLAFFVIMLGAYTRLTDAGLGCPDWPGCYGHLVAPTSTSQIQSVEARYPGSIVQSIAAWTEMVHRYFAGTLGLIIFFLAIWGFKRARKNMRHQPVAVPVLLVLLVIFQALLGMWTVTLKLLPLVVMGHLLGGMVIASLLWWTTLKSGNCLQNHTRKLTAVRPWAVIGLLIVFGQIFLGGWTSANYAALACPTFPGCHGGLFPHMDFAKAFNFISPIGANYEGGVLDSTSRITIQMVHRYGAFITATYVGLLSIYLIFSDRFAGLRPIGWSIFSILFVQFCLGVLNIEWLLPLPIAVLHNGVAALLLLAMVTLVYKLSLPVRGSFSG